MSERLPLFPLGTVLFPGLVLPLHIFEERYRALVRHLQRDAPGGAIFGVVAIERGLETSSLGGDVASGVGAASGTDAVTPPGSTSTASSTASSSASSSADAGATSGADADAAAGTDAGVSTGADADAPVGTDGGVSTGADAGASASAGAQPAGDRSTLKLHDVGCSAEIRQMTEHPDGRFDLVTVGRRRFRINEIHTGDAPFLMADIDWISEPEADSGVAEQMMPGLLEVFQRYLEMIRTDGRAGGEQLPDDPTVLSYVIAATAVLTVDDRQRLLAAPNTLDRLQLERRLLGREMAILRQVRALPVPLGDLATTPSPN